MKQHLIQFGLRGAKGWVLGLCCLAPVGMGAVAQTAQPAEPTQGLSTPRRAEATYPDVTVTDKPLQYRQFERVEITGSAILAKEAKQALPLQVIDRREIERSGAASLPDLLQRHPLMSNFSELGVVTGTVEGGPEAAAIHGHQSGTLVLLNGRRLPYYGSQTVMGERALVDLNFMPLAAIERIEILSDGASSRYGSDAVAGVVNVITRADIQGLNVGAHALLPQGGRGQGQGATLSWGQGRLQRDGYSVRAHFTAEKRQAVLAKDREVSSQGARSVQIDGETWWQNQRTTAYSAPAKNFWDADGVLQNIHYLETGRCEPGWYEIMQGECRRNAQGEMTLYPQTDKHLLFVQADRMMDNRWVLFAEGMLGQQKQSTVPDGAYWGLEVANTNASRRYLLDIVPLGLLRQQYTNKLHNFSLGVRGEEYGWDFIGSISTGRHTVQRAYTGGLARGSLFDDVFSPAIIDQHPADYAPETLAQMRTHQSTAVRELDRGFNHMNSFNFLASREVMEVDNGPVLLGVGLDWRQEQVSYASPEKTRPDFDGTRRVWAFHSEATLPLGPRSEVTGALRHDRYSDFGGVYTAKMGWKWQPHRAWLVRGSVGSGFRAPTIAQMLPTAHKISAYQDAQGQDVQINNLGNPLLEPERSIQKNLGLRYEPSPRWSWGADLWQLDIDNTFGVLTINQILTNDKLTSEYLDRQRQTLTQINQNLGRSVKRGIDYDVRWRQVTDFGRIQASFKGIYMLKSEKEDAVDGRMVSNIGVFTSPHLTTARHQWAWTTLLERANWVGGFTVHYKTGYAHQTVLFNTAGWGRYYTQTIPSHVTLDLLSRWQIERRLSVSANLINATHRMPAVRVGPQDNVLLGVDTRYANYMGRQLQLKLDYKF